MNIYSKGKYPADALSNFASHPFTFDGFQDIQSKEGLLQSLKFEDVRAQNSDMLVSHYVLQNQTKAEIERWLQEQFVSDATLEEIAQLLENLKDKLD
ncbi:MAG: hypothetical protein IKE65_06420 [Clostridia bacterium]|nr:hypothetical protein [Clostridia bacterium]